MGRYKVTNTGWRRTAARRRARALAVWLRDMAIFVVAFWGISWGAWMLLNLAVDAAIAEVNQSERAALDAQGREAWDLYCEAVDRGDRPDDLDAFHPDNGECGQMMWEPEGSD